jgi:hypothetical protein
MKKWLLLFMPFFMLGCKFRNGQPSLALAQRDSIAALLGQLQQRVAANDTPAIQQLSDSLAKLGQRYRWAGKAEMADSGFQNYILLNYRAGDSLRKWRGRMDKAACPFFDNIVPYGPLLQNGKMDTLYIKALYKATEPKFAFGYNMDVTANFEKCVVQYQAKPLLGIKEYYDVLQSLGIQYHALGEKELAKHYYDKAQQLAFSNQWPNKMVSASTNKYKFFIEYGQTDSVLANAPGILGLQGVDLKRMALARAYYAEALYAKGDPAFTFQLRQASDSLNRIMDNDADVLGKKSDILKLQGDIAFKERQYPNAIGLFKQALDTCFKKNDNGYKNRSYAKLLLKLADVYDSLQRYDTALYYSQFALACVTPVDSADIDNNPSFKDLYTENTILEALDKKAGLLLKKQAAQNDIATLQNAVQCFERAFEVEQKLLDNFTYDDSRAELQTQTQSKQRSAKAIQACYQLYRLTQQTYWAEKAFRFSESSKALILLEAIKKNLLSNRYQNNPLFKKVDSLQLQLAYAERQLLTGAADPAAAQLHKDKLANELDQAQKALYMSEPSYKNYRQQQDTALLANLRQQLLQGNRHLAEFFCNGADNYLFVVKQNGPLAFLRLDSVLGRQVDTLMGHFVNNPALDPQQYGPAAYRLFQACGLQAALPADELLLIPDGPLNRLPFDALVTNNNPGGFIKLPYLFQSVTTSYGYSAASLLQQPAGETAGQQVVAFAPVFAKKERGMQPLPKTEDEVKAIGAAQCYIGPEASIANFQRSFGRFDIIHIATHANADSLHDNNPIIEMYDGAFSMSELYATSLRQTDLVVLSACQTNQGNIDRLEGTLSLARGFYYAGAQNIVASLWKVDDASTAAIIQRFYANRGKGRYAEGLRKARQQYLQDAPADGNTAPYYWAAMMHIGGFGKNNGSTSSNWIIYALVILLPLIGGALWWHSKRRKI